jgi:hypothetical protein
VPAAHVLRFQLNVVLGRPTDGQSVFKQGKA